MNGILLNIRYYLVAVLAWSIVMLFFISMAIFIVLNLTPILIHFSQSEIAGVTHQQIISDYWHLMKYLQLPGGTLHFNYIAMSSSGRQHFSDVKSLFLINEVVLVASGIMGVKFIWYKKKKHQFWQLIFPLQGLIAGVPIVFTVVAINFDHYFIIFHYLLFSNKDWLFDPLTDPIINVLSETFFIKTLLLFVLLLEMELIGLYIISKHQSSSSE